MVWPFSSSNSAPAGTSSKEEEVWKTDPRNVASAAGTSSSSSRGTSSTEGSATSYHLNSDAKFDTSSSATSPDFVAPSAFGLLNNPAFDAAKLHPLAGLGKDEIEYLDIVDGQPSSLEGARTVLPSRGWSDNLCYGTGTVFATGIMGGGLLGAAQGFVRPLGLEKPSARLRLNAVLNQATRRGSTLGNRAGGVACVYTIADGAIDSLRGKHDMIGSMVSGAITGALYQCMAGVRPMAISASIFTAAAAAWSAFKPVLL